jgi:hypothetical protein
MNSLSNFPNTPKTPFYKYLATTEKKLAPNLSA